MTWLTPIAWIGLASLAIPLLIHLLVRQQTRRAVFPSLRFLQATPMSALTRRTLQDWPLLAVRMLILGAAVAALAAPVIRWPGREAAWASRVVRATVVVPPASLAPAEPDAFAAATFARGDARLALQEALAWLRRQPPAAREVLFAGTFTRGSISAEDLAVIPEDAGIRFAPEDPKAPREQRLSFVELRDGVAYQVTRVMTLSDDDTTLREVAVAPLGQAPVVVTAPAADRMMADAALRAVLARGVLLGLESAVGPSPRSVTVAWPGSVGALAVAIDRAFDVPFNLLEPVAIPRQTLSQWSRPPGPPPANAVPVDEGDRRVFWGVALALLAIEWWMRRQRRVPAAVPVPEVRVA